MSSRPRGGSVQVFAQDGHFEHERAVLVLILIDHADELLADIDLGGVLLLRTRLQDDALGAEGAAQVALDALDVVVVLEPSTPNPEWGGP